MAVLALNIEYDQPRMSGATVVGVTYSAPSANTTTKEALTPFINRTRQSRTTGMAAHIQSLAIDVVDRTYEAGSSVFFGLLQWPLEVSHVAETGLQLARMAMSDQRAPNAVRKTTKYST